MRKQARLIDRLHMIVTTTEKMEMKCGENLHTDNIVSKAAMTDVIFPSLFNAVTLSLIC